MVTLVMVVQCIFFIDPTLALQLDSMGMREENVGFVFAMMGFM